MDYATKEIKRVEEDKNTEIKRLNKVVDKLEQRIATLEKVLQSHAKCIGEIREVITDEWFKILPKSRLSYLHDTR